MFYYILLSLFLLLFAYLIFYFVDLIKTVRRMLHNIEVILEVLRKEQEFVDRLIFKSRDTIENIEETVHAIENAVEAATVLKEKWSHAHAKQAKA